MSELVPIKPPRTAVSVSGNVVIPAAIADAGERVGVRLRQSHAREPAGGSRKHRSQIVIRSTSSRVMASLVRS
jgi:hypothetical protein